jgi:hypothetical protein
MIRLSFVGVMVGALLIASSGAAVAQPQNEPAPVNPPADAPVNAPGTAPGSAPVDAPGTTPVAPPERANTDVDTWLTRAEPLFKRLEDASPILLDIAKGAFRRARRKISIGPTLGLFGGHGYADTTDVALTFGLGVEIFKIPVWPSIDNLRAIIQERAKAKLKQIIVDSFKGQLPDEQTAIKFAKEAWMEAVEEVLGLRNLRAKTMERPQLSIGLEGNRYFDSEVWATRLRAGIGIWKFTLAASVSTAFGDPKISIYAGPEIVVHFMMSKGPRSSVLDVFVRGDFELRSRGEPYSHDVYALGLRYLLDII